MESPCEGEYLDRLGCTLSQPEWLANTGLPLIVTVGGLWLGYLLLRRQIDHTLQVRKADRESAAVQSLGRALTEIVSATLDHSGTDTYWRSARWDGWGPLLNAVDDARRRLGDDSVFEPIVSGGRDLTWAWEACQAKWSDLERDEGQIPIIAGHLALDATLTPYWNAIEAAGERLMSWDGMTPLPSFEPWPVEHIPARQRDHEAHYGWTRSRADEFEHHLRDHEKRRRTR